MDELVQTAAKESQKRRSEKLKIENSAYGQDRAFDAAKTQAGEAKWDTMTPLEKRAAIIEAANRLTEQSKSGSDANIGDDLPATRIEDEAPDASDFPVVSEEAPVDLDAIEEGEFPTRMYPSTTSPRCAD